MGRTKASIRASPATVAAILKAQAKRGAQAKQEAQVKPEAQLDGGSDYEKFRQANIASNQNLLNELLGAQMNVPGGVAASISVLGIDATPAAPAPKRKKAAPKPKPKKAVKKEEDEENVPPAGTRRSARNAGKPVTSYAGDGANIVDRSKMPRMVSRPNKRWDEDVSDDEEREGGGGTVRVNRLVGRKFDPKTFGLIPGVKIGSWWETRAECSSAAIHAPFVAGISGGAEGAFSVALSGGYDDDVDMGEAFTYTGSGGRDLKGTKANPKNLRTAPQSSDQSFDNMFNKALLVSSQTRKPVRVIRGFKLPSKYAPKSGYRYDGVYIVEKAWLEPGNNPGRFKVCKFAFRRVPGQPPIPERSDDTDEEEEEEEDELEEEDKEEEEDDGEEEEDDKEMEDDEEMEDEEEEPQPARSKRAKVVKEEDEKPAPAPAKRGRGRPAKK